MSHEFPTAFLNSLGSPMEFMVVVFAILMLFGAKSLPNALRTLGKWSAQLRRISDEVQRELLEAEQPIHNARKAWEKEMQDFTVSSPSRPNPLSTPPPNPPDPTAPPAPSAPPAPKPEAPHAE